MPVQVTITLPAGVTIDADGSGKMGDGVAVVSGVAAGAVLAGHYTAATSSSLGAGKVVVVNAAGFGPGEFATVVCKVANGSSPRAGDFGLTGFKAVDRNGAVIAGIGGSFTADIR